MTKKEKPKKEKKVLSVRNMTYKQRKKHYDSLADIKVEDCEEI